VLGSRAVLTNNSTLYLGAMAGSGIVRVQVTGTYYGQPVSEVAQIALAPYTATFNKPPAVVGVGVTVNTSISLTAEAPADGTSWTYLQGNLSAAAIAGVELQSSNPAVLHPQRSTGGLNFSFLAVQPGTATLSFPPRFQRSLPG